MCLDLISLLHLVSAHYCQCLEYCWNNYLDITINTLNLQSPMVACVHPYQKISFYKHLLHPNTHHMLTLSIYISILLQCCYSHLGTWRFKNLLPTLLDASLKTTCSPTISSFAPINVFVLIMFSSVFLTLFSWKPFLLVSSFQIYFKIWHHLLLLVDLKDTKMDKFIMSSWKLFKCTSYTLIWPWSLR